MRLHSMEGERMNGVWQKAADRMRDSLGQVGYETWICPLNFLGLQDKTATIEVPNRFFRDYMTDKYLELLRQSLSAEVGEPVDIRLTLGKGENGNGNGHANGNGNGHGGSNGNGAKPASARAATALPVTTAEKPRYELHPNLNARNTFAEFVIGTGNQFAHAAALAVANQPGEKYNPLFIYGGVGLGKTHLATAIGHHLWATGARARKILFMPAEVF